MQYDTRFVINCDNRHQVTPVGQMVMKIVHSYYHNHYKVAMSLKMGFFKHYIGINGSEFLAITWNSRPSARNSVPEIW